MEEDNKSVSLSEPQLALMRILWQRSEATVSDVVEAMREQRSLAHTTIATMLSRLEKRGLISARKEGRLFFYSANVSESDIQKSMVSELLSSLFLGNARALLNHLVREDEIKPEDLEQMRTSLKDRTQSK
ncbi:BlaI/MecI/CopY family transcriptional regulator [Undibacterium cyanobacteriorum]|uniref:BlaI/MecI/CopY family transcriptional regulator n=1 Tax=Undibacterium cyanobacteriorum TaxID=3073561 RepID=A0ABY9RLN1_9BURK|nr:BlaI/MecI/CopY family transcriptional regulator [Undibacterium sp. 20NA77.5]WMW80906.1 BlaI/MecI/CopY family transcriptional regulator [Undibacterium sp. 20NA77.5]